MQRQRLILNFVNSAIDVNAAPPSQIAYKKLNFSLFRKFPNKVEGRPAAPA